MKPRVFWSLKIASLIELATTALWGLLGVATSAETAYYFFVRSHTAGLLLLYFNLDFIEGNFNSLNVGSNYVSIFLIAVAIIINALLLFCIFFLARSIWDTLGKREKLQ